LTLVSEVLLTVILVFFLPVALLMTVGTWARMSLRRANSVVPGRPAVAAPLRWLWSPGAAASLHRRLRSACQLAGSIEGAGPRPRPKRWPRRNPPPPSDAIAELAREVVQEAVQLDRKLVSASWIAPGVPRARALAALGYQVRAVEDAARRVHQLDAERSRIASPAGSGTLTLDERLTAMEAALGELTPRLPAGLVAPVPRSEPGISAKTRPLARPRSFRTRQLDEAI